MESVICKPALVYLVIALVLLFVVTLMNPGMSSFGDILRQIFGIAVCTLILMGLCAITPQISWIITWIFIFLTLWWIGSVIFSSI